VGWWYTLGSATLIAFVILVSTGIFMMMNYSPSVDHAWDSLQFASQSVVLGQYVRSIHHWAANAMMVLIGLHALRVFIMGAYKYPRETTWMVGVVLLLLVTGSAFSGYLLPWDQRAYWAVNVAVNMAGEAPLVGPALEKLMLGGPEIGTLTLNRFFTLHVAILPSLIGLVVALHLFLVVRLGISAPPGVFHSGEEK
jgi:quinol-cytochrome oxidoreductase complex cytochrome b subunit